MSAPAEAAVPAPRAEGFIDVLSANSVSGWAWLPAEPARSVDIEVLFDGRLIATANANAWRPDVAEAGRGTGCYGFRVDFEREIEDPRRLAVRVCGTDIALPVAELIEGFVNSFSPDAVTGWAWLPSNPSEALTVAATVDGAVIAETVASQFRPDVAGSGRGTGRYGFKLAFDPPWSGQPPVIFARSAIGAVTPLPLNELVFGGFEPMPAPDAFGRDDVAGSGGNADSQGAELTAATYEGEVETLTRLSAAGWVWNTQLGNEALEVRAMLDGQIIASAFANLARPELARAGKGSGHHGFSLVFERPLREDEVPEIIASGVGGQQYRLPVHGLPALAAVSGSVQMTGKAPAFMPPQIEGYVDELLRSGASGWVWAPSAPELPLEVEVVQDHVVVGRGLAEQMRPDLKAAGKGTGRYGFRIKFDRPLLSETAPEFRVLVAVGDKLKGAPALPALTDMDLQRAKHVLAPASFQRPAIEGSVDELSRSGVSGWVCAPSEPSLAFEVEVLSEGRVLGRAVANQPRPDLKAAGKGTGNYGFRVKLDQPILADAVPEIRVLLPTEQQLKGPSRLPPLTAAEQRLKDRGTPELFAKEHAQFTSRGKDFEEFAPALNPVQRLDGGRPPMVMAFYLPQFHPIRENDAFWGQGFTEWRQILRGVPRFPGHYQPRIPRDLGFYDLRDVNVLKQQVEFALASGVDVFAYYYYWFNGRRVLEKPLDILLESDVEMPFALIWANENWTKTWDGFDSDILLRQDYKDEDDEALVDDFARHFNDRRYMRIDGRPFFVIYNPKNIPDPAKKIAIWRELLKTKYELEPIIFMAQTFGDTDPRPYGLDGAMEFPPHKLSNPYPGRATPDAYSSDFTGRVIDYEDYIRTSLGESEPDYPLIKTIVPSWDNDARRPGRGLTLEGASPAKYENWLAALLERAMNRPVFGAPIVAVNAWNEWAEGAYLEPDVYYGSAYLNATARARNAALERRNAEFERQLSVDHDSLKVTVIFPNFNHARYLETRLRSVIEQSVRPDEIIFLDDCSSDNSLEVARRILADCGIPYRIVENEKNSGGVFRQWMKGLAMAAHDIIWIAETDDEAHKDFLYYALPAFSAEHVLAAFGRISCMDESGNPLPDLDGYLDGMRDFSWNFSAVVPAFRAFAHDFAVKNIVPNASGLLFRKPKLSESEMQRLFSYRFAGDWYFYALMLRGGAIAYCSNARSYFRVSRNSTSRGAFYSDAHLQEHKMAIEDLWREYDIPAESIEEHAAQLAVFFPQKTPEQIHRHLLADLRADASGKPLRVCIAAHSFAVGGGEVLPLELANALHARGHHVTYLVMERLEPGQKSIRTRLASNVAVVYWDEVAHRFGDFMRDYGIEILNTHNVGLEYHLAARNIEIDIPYVASLHGGYETVPHILTGKFVDYVNKYVDTWLSLSEKNNTLLLKAGVPSSVFAKSFNAVPPYLGERVDRAKFRKQHGISKDAFVLFICSRAIVEKGWQIAVNVIKRLAAGAKRPVHLVLIGEGPAATELQAANVDLACVTFLGHVASPIRYFKCFDLAVFPSTFAGETFPLFLLECFQEGLPAVSTDIGEIPYIMGEPADQRPGAMVKFNQDAAQIESDMVATVGEIIDNKRLYAAWRKNALKVSKKFSLERLVDFYLSAFHSLAKKS